MFKATGTKNLFLGYLIVYKEELDSRKDKQKTDIPHLIKDELLNLHEIMCNQHFTKPPPRYTDASLVKTLEEKGIGRPSTYAPTIYVLTAREYITRERGSLTPTELGEVVIKLLVQYFPNILDYEFTARMEDELDKIEEGDLEWAEVLKEKGLDNMVL